LEVGVGTGRFAHPLGVPFGLDPSLPSLRLARGRVPYRVVGRGEMLPFRDGTFDVVLLVVSICFLDDPDAALAEIGRVLVEGGRLLVGYVPANSRIGREYSRKGAAGHRFYAHARFWTTGELEALARRRGFVREGFRTVRRAGAGYVLSAEEDEDSIFSVLRLRRI